MPQALERCSWDPGAISVPLQHAADEEVIAPGEKSSENYQIVKGVSETESCPQGCPWQHGQRCLPGLGWHGCTSKKGRAEIMAGISKLSGGSVEISPSQGLFPSAQRKEEPRPRLSLALGGLEGTRLVMGVRALCKEDF